MKATSVMTKRSSRNSERREERLRSDSRNRKKEERERHTHTGGVFLLAETHGRVSSEREKKKSKSCDSRRNGEEKKSPAKYRAAVAQALCLCTTEDSCERFCVFMEERKQLPC